MSGPPSRQIANRRHLVWTATLPHMACLWPANLMRRVCIHVCIYVIFKLGFEPYGGGIVLVGRGVVWGIVRERRELSRGEMSGPPIAIAVPPLWNQLPPALQQISDPF